MTLIDEHTTLGELVTAHPGLARELERLGLDYCCGGARTVHEACAEQRLDPIVVVAELAGAVTDEVPAPWAAMEPEELVDHLVSTHHQYLWAELPRLSTLLEKVVSAHAARHPELHEVRRTFEEARADLEPHMRKEEEVLFPMIRELAGADTEPSFHCGSLRNPISVMMVEHERVGELLTQLREISGDYEVPADGCASYQAGYAGLAEFEADTHLHVHKENNLLFPAVLDPRV